MFIKRTLPPASSPIAIEDILNGFKGLLRGPTEIESFKSDIKKHFQVRYCFLLSSGKAALTAILKSLQKISPGQNEVLIPAFTCYSVPSAIVRAGLKVRLCDVDPATLDFDFNELKINLKRKDTLLAVVCPHLFGLPASINNIRKLLPDPKIAIIEDAAQAMGGVANQRILGTLGDVGFFSLGRGKAFSTVAGGVIVTNSDRLARIINKSIKELTPQSHINKVQLIVYSLSLSALMHPSLFWLPKSMPGLRLGETIYDPQFPMKSFSSFQAGIARNWRKRLSSFQTERKQNALLLTNELQKFQWLKPIYLINGSIPMAPPLIRLPVLVQNVFLRNALLEESDKRGFGIMPSYPNPIDKINKLRLEHKDQTFQGAKKCASLLVTFPVHGFISPKDRQRIVRSLDAIQAKNQDQITV